jgi:hypothetical protein
MEVDSKKKWGKRKRKGKRKSHKHLDLDKNLDSPIKHTNDVIYIYKKIISLLKTNLDL